ncbi:hypothetical protein ABT294_00590 [Nonomuraea sp. NPDC000554]|uniref:hypothetical protein n=1 Tax=Nonomuraea sp. NPDC000554 TaxID=3154259 RepID=UPI00332DEE42
MTAVPSLALMNGLLAMLRAAVPTCSFYWAGAAAGAEGPYAVLYPTQGLKSAFHRSLTNDAPTEVRYQVTAVGKTPDQAAWVADKVTAALFAGVPTVAGQRVWPAVQESAQPVRRDDESLTVFIATSQWLTRSDPA